MAEADAAARRSEAGAARSGPPVLEVRHLRKAYPISGGERLAIEDVSF